LVVETDNVANDKSMNLVNLVLTRPSFATPESQQSLGKRPASSFSCVVSIPYFSIAFTGASIVLWIPLIPGASRPFDSVTLWRFSYIRHLFRFQSYNSLSSTDDYSPPLQSPTTPRTTSLIGPPICILVHPIRDQAPDHLVRLNPVPDPRCRLRRIYSAPPTTHVMSKPGTPVSSAADATKRLLGFKSSTPPLPDSSSPGIIDNAPTARVRGTSSTSVYQNILLTHLLIV
jgi:hypothetical protein